MCVCVALAIQRAIHMHHTVICGLYSCTFFHTILRSAHTVFVWIWEQTAIISLYSINWQPSGYYICTTKYNIQQFYALSTQCICVDLRTNSDFSLYSTDWLLFITEI